MERLSGFAWLIVFVLAWLVALPSDWLDDAIGEGRAGALYYLVGIALGVLWYALRPRSFAERLFGWAALFTVLAVPVIVPVLSVELDVTRSDDLIPLGIVAGLVFAERRALARREPARELPRRDVAA